jgi:putative ABC transport system permease protein
MRSPAFLRRATRSLARRPGLSLLAIATLGLGIGANTAIFSIVNVTLLKPLPFPDPERLMVVWSTAPGQGTGGGFASYPDFHDWREQSGAFDGLAAFWTFPNGDVNLTGGTEPQRVSVARVTPGFFEVLGIRPLHGRTFQVDETVVGNHRRAMLSHGLWRRQFGGDSTLVGRAVMVNGFPYAVVGIMPPESESRGLRALGTAVDLWRPLVPDDNQTGGRDARKLRVIGRLREGVGLAAAEQELAAVASRLSAVYPETNRDAGVRLIPLREQVVRDVRRGLMFLWGAVGVVLLGACVNVATLLLIKAAATRKEIAVQYALGASRARLVGQVLAECLLLAGAGTAVGVLIGFAGVQGFVAAGPRDIPLLSDARLDGAVLGFTVLAALLTVLLVSVVPAWRSTLPEAAAALRQGGGISRRGEDRRVMDGLTVVQIALAMLLLSAGGLLVRSFQALLRVDPGLRAERTLTFQLELPMATTYPSQDGRDAFFATLLEQVGGLPGVRGVTLASAPPVEEEPNAFTFGRPGVEDRRTLRASFRLVAPNYFSLLGVPIAEGRGFDPRDRRDAPRVVIVSAALARSVWGERSPIGERIAPPFGGEAVVVGVAGDVRTTGLDGEPAHTVYVPASQGTYNFMTVVIKSGSDPAALVPAVRALVGRLDANLPLYRVRTLDDLLAQSVAPQRFQMLLVGTFSLLAFVLAIIGTYGVASYGVSERAGELGIRMALGATGEDIRRFVLREGARLVVLGIVVGGLGAVAASRLLSRLVFRISPLDPVTLVAAPLLLASAVAVATLLPARRAARVDPMRVLRAE